MKVSTRFPQRVIDAEMKPSDFFMVHAGWFHAYAKKINKGPNAAGEFEPEKQAISIHSLTCIPTKFETPKAATGWNEDDEPDDVDHILLHTEAVRKATPKHSKNMEIFLKVQPPGSTLVPYWTDKDWRTHDDIRAGRITYFDLQESMEGWAFELLTLDQFGMCFQYEGDAVLFAGMLPETKQELKERERKSNAPPPSLKNRKLAW